MPSLSREPLVVRSAIVAAVTATIHVLVVLGVLPFDESQEQAVAGAVDLIGTAVAVVWGRAAVTPVADPDLAASEAFAEAEAGDVYTPRH